MAVKKSKEKKEQLSNYALAAAREIWRGFVDEDQGCITAIAGIIQKHVENEKKSLDEQSVA